MNHLSREVESTSFTELEGRDRDFCKMSKDEQGSCRLDLLGSAGRDVWDIGSVGGLEPGTHFSRYSTGVVWQDPSN
jgi:hypothetical protein